MKFYVNIVGEKTNYISKEDRTLYFMVQKKFNYTLAYMLSFMHLACERYTTKPYN